MKEGKSKDFIINCLWFYFFEKFRNFGFNRIDGNYELDICIVKYRDGG